MVARMLGSCPLTSAREKTPRGIPYWNGRRQTGHFRNLSRGLARAVYSPVFFPLRLAAQRAASQARSWQAYTSLALLHRDCEESNRRAERRLARIAVKPVQI